MSIAPSWCGTIADTKALSASSVGAIAMATIIRAIAIRGRAESRVFFAGRPGRGKGESRYSRLEFYARSVAHDRQQRDQSSTARESEPDLRHRAAHRVHPNVGP
jgi:hypothetical protein